MKVKNRLFKSAAVVLSVLLLISSLSAAASAAGRTEFGMINEYETASQNKNYIAEHEDVLERLYEGCMNHEESIDILSYGLAVNDYYSLVPALLGVYPELFFVDTAGGATSGGYLAAITPVYTATKEEADAMLDEFYAKADEYLALISDGMDDFTKAVVLHDALVLNSNYKIEDSTNYTFMVEGWGRCENYAECYAYLLSKVGIKSEIINSEAMVHEWLKIQLDGSEYYYNVDLTYDDPLYSDYGDMPDKVSHTYFLLSDELIQQIDHHDYEYINEAGDAYDGHNNLHDLKNPMFYANGDLYTLYVSDNTGYIATYDHADDNFTNKLTITDKWSADAYGAGATWNGNFSGIGEYGGLLYFNGDNCIYCYDPKTGVKTDYIETAMTDGRHLYGMYIQDGKIYGKASSDPNSDFDFVYVGDCISSYNVEVSDSIAHGTVAADKLAAAAGETVTLTVKPDEEFVVKQVTVNNAEITPTDGVYQFEMPSEDAYVSAEFDFADGMGAISGYTLSLKGDIGVNFYMELADDIAGSDSAYMLFTVPNGDSAYEKSVKVSDAEKVTDENSVYYVFECGVFAKDMVSDIKARIVDGDTYGTEYSYSVEKYAKYILDHPEVDEYASAANMVKAMLNYGSYSQVFFNNNVTNLANASLEENDKVIDDVTAALINKSAFSETLPADVTFAGASLSLQSETTLSLYFKSASTLSFDCPNRVFETAVSGQYQVIRIRNISAKEIGDDFTVSVSADDTQGTISYSPMNYCYNVLNNDAYADNTNLQNVVRSIYKYWQAAKYYFNYNI